MTGQEWWRFDRVLVGSNGLFLCGMAAMAHGWVQWLALIAAPLTFLLCGLIWVPSKTLIRREFAEELVAEFDRLDLIKSSGVAAERGDSSGPGTPPTH